jgi:hypothetical protein
MKTVIDNWDGSQTVVALEDGNLITGTVQDCTPLVERTKALHRAGIHGSSEMRHAASFPAVLVEKYCNEKGITFQEWIGNPTHAKAMLTDPTLKDFRVWGGRV